MKPKDLLARLLTGAVTNVAFADAQSLLKALRFEELRVQGAITSTAVPASLSSSIFKTGPHRQSRTNCDSWLLVRRYDLIIEEDN